MFYSGDNKIRMIPRRLWNGTQLIGFQENEYSKNYIDVPSLVSANHRTNVSSAIRQAKVVIIN